MFAKRGLAVSTSKGGFGAGGRQNSPCGKCRKPLAFISDAWVKLLALSEVLDRKLLSPFQSGRLLEGGGAAFAARVERRRRVFLSDLLH
jgi:hypothetical protein